MPNKLDNSSIRTLKKSQCPQIAPSSTGKLTYEAGYSEDDQQFHLRVTSNTGGGYFSHEWISLNAIQETIEAQPDGQPFKSLVLRKLYASTGANNYGFLAAVLRAEGILLPVPKAPYSHLPGDLMAFKVAMQNSLKPPMKNSSRKKPTKRKSKASTAKRTAKAS